ncbi:amidohydrolase [Crossiella sp. CA198]|uniref:amidohydrolase n=1 Tax=Crossiella sp. CA198 TaxID=3455607 RepID=UPI003F8D6BE7
MRVDTVFHNARVRTGGAAGVTDALAVLDGRIVALGQDCADLSARQRIDLGGSTVTPGFHDAHNHLSWYGMSLDEVPLNDCRSTQEVYAAIARRAAGQPAGSWVIGSGYDQTKLAGGHPTRTGLDRAAPDHHVWLKHTSGHMCVVNSLVLGKLDLATVPEGGDLGRDEHGDPTGLLREQAQLLLRPLVYPTPLDVVERSIDRATRQYLAEGITSVQEAGVGGGWIGRTPLEIAAYQRARAAGKLHVRTTLMVISDALHELDRHPTDQVSLGLDLGLHSGFGDDHLRIGPVKIFADGSLVGRTAAMHEPFAGDPDNRGYFQLPEADLRELIDRLHAAGWQIATHAIGDRAIAEVLDAYAAALHRTPRPDHRHRIEHCAIAGPAEIARIAELGVIPVPQGRFLSELGDGMASALGDHRIDWCYRQRSFLDAGIPLPGSSDRPVVNGNPLLGMADMVRRHTATGVPFGPESERLTPEQALRAYTWGSAYAAFREHRVGTLTPGKLADFAVLSADPVTEGFDAAQVRATALDGTLAHNPEGF